MAITTAQLAERLAGGDSYIRTKNNVVKGLAITTRDNPQAPEIIVVGSGPRIIANAKLFLDSQTFVPVYVKQDVNKWEFFGDYKATSYRRDPETIEMYREHRPAAEVDGILFLTSKEDIIVNIQSKSKVDVEARRKVELAAIETVTLYYKHKDYTVHDFQKDNCGYDLLVKKGKRILKIEVKGTSSTEQRFFLSRNERSNSVDPLWRLAIVTEALSAPKLEIMKTETMESRFNFDPMCWECTRS